MMADLIRYFVGVLLLAIPQIGYSQLPNELPKLVLKNKAELVDENFPGGYCVRQFYQDKKGRLWIATCSTVAGPMMLKLFQYDGYATKVANIDYERTAVRSSVQLVDYVDGLGLLGYIKSRELSILFAYDERQDSSRQLIFPEGLVEKVIPRAEGGYWIISRADADVFIYEWERDLAIKKIAAFRLPIKQMGGNKTRIDQNDSYELKGDFLYGSLFCLRPFRYHLQQKTVEILDYEDQLETDGEILCPEQIQNQWKYFYNHNNKLYFLPSVISEHFYVLEEDLSYKPVGIIPKGGWGRGIYGDQSGNMVFVYQTKDKALHAVLLDREGNYWDYSSMVDWLGKRILFTIYGDNFKQKAFIGTNRGAFRVIVGNLSAIRTFLPETGIRWIGESGRGQFLVKKIGRGVINLSLEQKESSSEWDRSCRSAYFQDNVFSSTKFFQARNGTNWACAENRAFQLSPDPDDGNCKFFSLDFDARWMAFLPDSRIAYFTMQGTSSVIWIQSGIENTDSIVFKKIALDLNTPVNDLLASKDGYLWLSTLDGLYKVHPDRTSIQQFGEEAGFEDFRITDLYEAKNGQLWVGTVKGGIHLFNPKTNRVETVFNKENGLTNNTIASILEDEEGDIWVGTFNGLSIISGEDWQITNLNVEDGLSHYEFNRDSKLRSADGKLLLGTLKGLNVIDPIAFKKDYFEQDTLRIYLTEIASYDEELDKMVRLPYFDSFSEPISLDADHRNLKLKVALSNYGSSQENKFFYKLEGIDEDWNYLGTQHQIHLSALPVGKYTLLVNGIDKRGNWADTPIAIPIHAKAHFYQTIWFYLLILGIIIGGAIFWLLRLGYEKRRLATEVKKRTREIEEDKEVIEQQASELKEQARELQEADEMKTRFFTNISHELRTPATLIATPVAHVLNKFRGEMSDSLKSSLQLVQNNSGKLLELIEELLELSRFDAGKMFSSPELVPLYSFCRQIFSAFESATHLKDISYQINYQLPKNLQVAIDKKQVEKVLNNLLSNALKFTPKYGQITLDVSTEPGRENADGLQHLLFKVQDTGRGISEEDLPRVFDRYFQTRNKALPTEGGTGIGLSLARELARLMGGALWVESQWGEGSTFYFSLPAKAEEMAEAEAFIAKTNGKTPTEKVGRKAESGNGEKPAVLIVEDNEGMQQLLGSVLADFYHCVFADNGAEAWQLLQSNEWSVDKLDLIISDLMMPEMDGYALLQKLKEHTDWQQLPVIMLTARAAEEDRLKALRLGVDDYLNKPFSPDELLARADNLIRNYHRRKAYLSDTALNLSIDLEPSESVDQRWLAKLEKVALEALDRQQELNAFYLAAAMNISDRQLLRQLKPLTGLSVKQYIQEVKLQKARHYLEQKTFATVAEVSYACGFNTPGYFSTLFEKRFGKRPVTYLG